jgi:hypothetical protein
MHTLRHFFGGYSTTTTYYAIANQSPLYDAVFSQIEYPYFFKNTSVGKVRRVEVPVDGDGMADRIEE